MRVHHTNIRVVDPVPEVSFLRALGFRLSGCMHIGEIYTLYLALPADRYFIELTVNENADDSWPRDMGSAHLALVVEDLDATLARIAANGILPIVAPMNPGGRSDVRIAFLQGPSGYKVELIDGGDFNPPREKLPTALGSYD